MAKQLYQVLWLALPFMKAAAALVLYRRKIHLRFPLFFSFLVYGTITSVVLWAQHNLLHVAYKTYFYTYWTTDALYVMFVLAVVYEMFTSMFRQHQGLQDFGSVLFRWAGVVSVLMAITLVFGNPAADPHRLMNFILAAGRGVGVVQCGLLLFLLLFARSLGITWRHQVFGFAFGLGAYSCIRFILLTQWARALFGNTWFSILDMTAYHFAVIAWMVYAFLPQPVGALPSLLKPQRWSEALLHATNPLPEQTVLLGIEDIVDRALTKTNGIHEAN